MLMASQDVDQMVDVGAAMSHAVIVSRELDIRVVDTISVMSYNHQTQVEGGIMGEADAGDLQILGADLLARML